MVSCQQALWEYLRLSYQVYYICTCTKRLSKPWKPNYCRIVLWVIDNCSILHHRVVITLCDVVWSRWFHLYKVLRGLLSYILWTGTGQTEGSDVSGATSRVILTGSFGERTQLPRQQLMTYCPNLRAEVGCCFNLFQRLVR